MHFSNLIRSSVAAGALALGIAVAAAPASAEISVAAGGMFSGSTTTAGGIVSLGLLSLPVAPVSAELSVAVPFNNGGYAATLDGRANLAGTTLGAGIGFGTLGNTAQTTAIYDAIIAHGIAPHTSLEGRVYFGSNRSSTVFAGVRLSL